MAFEKVPVQDQVFGVVQYAFVVDEYKSNGLLTRMIEQAENEARKQQLSAVLILGLQDCYLEEEVRGWELGEVRVKYRVKFIKPLRSIFKMSDIKKPLITYPCVHLDEKDLDSLKESLEGQVAFGSKLNKEYICWRYLMAKDTDFVYVNNQDVFAVAVVGNGGHRIKDVQILMMASKKGRASSNRFKKMVIDRMVGQVHPDTVSCMGGDHYLTRGNSIGISYKMPVCYKRFDEEKEVSLAEIEDTVMRYFV